MNVNEFIEGYIKLGLDNLKDEYIKERIVKKYISYSDKVINCKNIAISTTHRVEVLDGNEVKFFADNSIDRRMLFMMKIIEYYTDIEIIYDKTLYQQYDALLETNTLPLLFELIDVNEIRMWESLLQMALDDIYTNEQGIINWLEEKFNSLRLTAGSIGEVLQNAIDVVSSNE